MKGGLGNGSSEGGHTGLVCLSGDRGHSHLGLDLAGAGGSCSVQGDTEEKNHGFQIRKASWRRRVGNRDRKEGRGRAGEGSHGWGTGRQISWPG